METNVLYIKMAAAAADAIEALEAANYGCAKEILIQAMQECEEICICEDEN